MAAPDARISFTAGTINGITTLPNNLSITGFVEVDTGTGFVPAPDGTTINFAIQGGTTSGGGGGYVGGINSGSTGGGTGQVTVTVTISSIHPIHAGTSINRASTTVTVLGTPLSRSTNDGVSGDGPNAVLTWVWARASAQII